MRHRVLRKSLIVLFLFVAVSLAFLSGQATAGTDGLACWWPGWWGWGGYYSCGFVSVTADNIDKANVSGSSTAGEQQGTNTVTSDDASKSINNTATFWGNNR